MSGGSGGGGRSGRGGGGDISVEGTSKEFSGVDTHYWEKGDVEKEIKKATRRAEYAEKNIGAPFSSNAKEDAVKERKNEAFWRKILDKGIYGKAGKEFKGKLD